MSRIIPPEPPHDPVFTVIDMGAEAKRIWGPKFNAPELAYEFAGGKRKFYLNTGDAAIYVTSPDFSD